MHSRLLQRDPDMQKNALELAMVASTLTRWQEPDEAIGTSSLQPIRASDLAAKSILDILAEKEAH